MLCHVRPRLLIHPSSVMEMTSASVSFTPLSSLSPSQSSPNRKSNGCFHPPTSCTEWHGHCPFRALGLLFRLPQIRWSRLSYWDKLFPFPKFTVITIKSLEYRQIPGTEVVAFDQSFLTGISSSIDIRYQVITPLARDGMENKKSWL